VTFDCLRGRSKVDRRSTARLLSRSRTQPRPFAAVHTSTAKVSPLDTKPNHPAPPSNQQHTGNMPCPEFGVSPGSVRPAMPVPNTIPGVSLSAANPLDASMHAIRHVFFSNESGSYAQPSSVSKQGAISALPCRPTTVTFLLPRLNATVLVPLTSLVESREYLCLVLTR
jgi:hypothetical protein